MKGHHEETAVAPEWWHHHGIKMNVALLLPEAHLLIVAAPAASVRIIPVASMHDEGWYVDWEIRHSQRAELRGRIVMYTEALKAAFRLPSVRLADDLDQYRSWLHERFGADYAEQGQFIRQGRYLNIPGPGTGHDGDSNVSVYVDDGITEAARRLLGA